MLLGLPRESLISSRVDSVTSHPSSLYAVEIVGRWRDKHPMSLVDAHEELANQLRKLHLNFAVPMLRGEERKTVVGKHMLIMLNVCVKPMVFAFRSPKG